MLSPDLLQALQTEKIEIRIDPATRLLYSTDASIYHIEPLGVAFPRSDDELAACVSLAARHDTPILARGAGSSLAGQAIGRALILDCSRYLDRIEAIHLADGGNGGEAIVQPGVILNALNRAAARHGLQFGPDPASAERATVGGSLANNASGAHSILYGMFADHLLSADVILADGSLAHLGEISLEEIQRQAAGDTALARFLAACLHIRQHSTEAIQAHWPRTWRNASGYALNYLIPWSPSVPPLWEQTQGGQKYPPAQPGSLNLAALLAGSEGTLAVVRRATLRLVARPRRTLLAVQAYPGIAEACEDTPRLLSYAPSAVELIPRKLIRLARGIPSVARQMSWMEDNPAALLVVEFSGDSGDEHALRQRARAALPDSLLAETPQAQKQIWEVRKLGLGILQSQPGQRKPVTFIEDISIPVDSLGQYVRAMQRILAEYGGQADEADFYAHASAGCLHMRPLLDIKSPQGRRNLRAIAEQTVELVASLGGTMSGEHGDGQARGEWLERIYGPQVVAAFWELKAAADPHNLLNPGKIVSPPPMDSGLRRPASSQALGWSPLMDFTRNGGAPGAEGVVGAIEMCNGAGVCRKIEGTMCPSFQATRDEKYSTRGRANLLRAMLAGEGPVGDAAIGGIEAAAYEALDLCLACKGCRAECPSAVDMAKLKYEFMQAYYSTHPHKLRDYLFGYINQVAPLGAPFGPLANAVMANRLFRRLAEQFFGLSAQRPFPRFTRSARPALAAEPAATPVLFLRDTFNHYFYPQTEAAALRVLAAAGCRVIHLPVMGAGRTLISKGFLEAAKKHAARLVEAIHRLDPQGTLPVVGIEPSEIYTLRDELPDFFPSDRRVPALAARSWMIDEFLLRPGPDGHPYLHRLAFEAGGAPSKVLLHGHCYQKAMPPAGDGFPTGVGASVALLAAAGHSVRIVDDGCCGMAGAFGYEAEHYEVSMKVGELALFPEIRAAIQTASETKEDIIVAAAGVSCHSQIADGTGQDALHPIILLANRLKKSASD